MISSALIENYTDSHEEMLKAICALEELTREPMTNLLRLSHTRLRITRAGHECRSAFRKIAPILSRDGTPALARMVEELEEHHLELKELAYRHRATWTLSEIQSDWPGYCRSGKEIRDRWRLIIERERELLSRML